MLLTITLVATFLTLLSGIAPVILFHKNSSAIKFTHFSLLGISGIVLVATGLIAIINNAALTMQFSFGFPLLSYSVRLDPLAGFFLLLIGIIIVAIAFYGPGYIKYYEKSRTSINSLILITGIFIFSMCFVVLANNVFSFLFSWELMSLSSYYLVIYHHENSENRQAGFVYLIMAHLSGLLILLSLGILAKFSGSCDFQLLSKAKLTPIWASIAFLLALFGFATKAGLVPLHAWLPKAHPAAPSHISALMSGVMLKIAVYGFIRFSYTLIGQFYWQWGVLVLFLGCLSAILGVLYALMQHDLKRLLAYHSVENIGIIFIGIGLSIIFISNGSPILGALGLIAALYHCLNHALFKSLLFLGAGSIIQHTHEHDLEHMGGLIHKIPMTSLFFLIGCISISGLPPFNGFVSEWLTFQTSLQTAALHGGIIRIMIPLAAATLALTGALAATCFAKVYGVAFLGKARTRRVKNAKKPGIGMRFSMGLLAALCLLFGILPTFTINLINRIPLSLLNTGLLPANLKHWFWIIPISPTTSAYNASLVFIGLIVFAFLIYLLIRRFSPLLVNKCSAWDCGFGGLNARMQYTATAFAMPIRRVFSKVWQIEEHYTKQKYELHIGDWIWYYCYQPLNGLIQKIAKTLAKLQGGNIRIYLLYTFVTLLLLLLVVA